METLQGTVTHARHTTHVSGNSSRTTTQHIAIFEIGGVLVTYRGPRPVLIEQGDEVRVVGSPGAGERTMSALAYRNLTRDVVDNSVQTGCIYHLLWILGCGLGTFVLLSLLGGNSPSAVLGDVIPGWVWIAAGTLLVLAILGDFRLFVRRQDVLAELGDG